MKEARYSSTPTSCANVWIHLEPELTSLRGTFNTWICRCLPYTGCHSNSYWYICSLAVDVLDSNFANYTDARNTDKLKKTMYGIAMDCQISSCISPTCCFLVRTSFVAVNMQRKVESVNVPLGCNTMRSVYTLTIRWCIFQFGMQGTKSWQLVFFLLGDQLGVGI